MSYGIIPNMSFEIKTEYFEGPIDILLQLIEKRKMTINDISLVEITDDYINYINSIENQSLINMTHFIFIASTLTLIKSKSLLPNLELTEEEDGDIEDLKLRLELLKVFVEISQSFKKIGLNKRRFYLPNNRKNEVIFTPHKDLVVSNIKEALLNVLSEVPKEEVKKKEAYVRIAINIEEMMGSLEERIKKSIETNFSTFISNKVSNKKEKKEVKVYNVIGFLAMLELVKNGILNVLQEESFKEISMKIREKEVISSQE